MGPRRSDAALLVVLLYKGGVGHVRMWIEPRVGGHLDAFVAHQESGSANVDPSLGFPEVPLQQLLVHLEVGSVNGVVLQQPCQSRLHLWVVARSGRGLLPASADNALLLLGRHRRPSTAQDAIVDVECEESQFLALFFVETPQLRRPMVSLGGGVSACGALRVAPPNSRPDGSSSHTNRCHPSSQATEITILPRSFSKPLVVVVVVVVILREGRQELGLATRKSEFSAVLLQPISSGAPRLPHCLADSRRSRIGLCLAFRRLSAVAERLPQSRLGGVRFGLLLCRLVGVGFGLRLCRLTRLCFGLLLGRLTRLCFGLLLCRLTGVGFGLLLRGDAHVASCLFG